LRLYSYIVRYDCGFAPNPFFGFCTLATCKPNIRKHAQVGDWIVGSGSADRSVRKGGVLVYAMRVTETLTFRQYWNDARFGRKKPNLYASLKLASGDNIYRWSRRRKAWDQLPSYHSHIDGSADPRHVQRDTRVDRVLASTDFVYFGGHGPIIPHKLRKYGGLDVVKTGRGLKVFSDADTNLVRDFGAWIDSLAEHGFVHAPLDWSRRR